MSLASTNPTTIEPDAAGASGVSSTAARSDHTHAIVAAAPSAALTGLSNAEGSATSFARSDHTHAINLPRVSVYASAAQSTTNNTDKDVLYDSENFDSDGFHSTASNTNRLTVPDGYSGVYSIQVDIAWALNTTGARYILVYLNGGAGTLIGGVSMAPGPTFATRQSYALLYYLSDNGASANDYVSVVARQTSGGALNINASNFSMFRVGS